MSLFSGIKRSDLLWLILFIAILNFNVYRTRRTVLKFHNIQMQVFEQFDAKLDSIHNDAKRRNYIDTLYWEHIRVCAFETKDGIDYIPNY